jgi:hypothetical protein
MFGYRFSLAANGLSNLNISYPNHTKGCKIPIVLILSIEIMACSTSTHVHKHIWHTQTHMVRIISPKLNPPLDLYLVQSPMTLHNACLRPNVHLTSHNQKVIITLLVQYNYMNPYKYININIYMVPTTIKPISCHQSHSKSS